MALQLSEQAVAAVALMLVEQEPGLHQEEMVVVVLGEIQAAQVVMVLQILVVVVAVVALLEQETEVPVVLE